ncbi:ankyrin repeat-containing domain protein [Aspergillus karnatakaensis]|uniref:ankyrin repeat domain-containing protein n=1 Tax=Aspergillus karnatakaensis TaxID=1810916 RepID=UPI003CCD2C9B
MASGLGVMPSELILDISEHLKVTALNSLLQTSWRFHNLLHSRLYKLARTYRDVPAAGTPLVWAVQSNKISVLKTLLQGDGWPSDNTGRTTALHQAILLNNGTALKILLDAGADLLITDAANNTPLLTAVNANNESAIKLLITAHLQNHPTSSFEPEWTKALTHAVSTHPESTCKALLESIQAHTTPDLNLNLQNAKDSTLHIAAGSRGDCTIIHLLVAFGANPLPSPSSTSPNPSLTLLTSAAAYGHTEAMKLALTYGINPNTPDPHGKTALHHAARTGNLEPVELLLAAGANINARCETGTTPLLLAVSMRKIAVARYLLDCGADIHAQNRNGFNVIDLAIARETGVEMVEMLLDRGAKAYLRSGTPRMTPLHWAARMGNVGLVRLLCGRGSAGAGVKVDTLDQRGRTALHLAVKQDHPGSAAALIEAGADVSRADEEGVTPLHAAVRVRSRVLVGLLLAAGADVGGVDGEGRTALGVAEDSEDEGICQLLREYGAK